MNQDIYGLANPGLLGIDKIYFGGNQAWFPSHWQRQAGCGPTAAATVLLYHALRRGARNICPAICQKDLPVSRQDMADFMGQIWEYVTPGMQGLHRAEDFIYGTDNYLGTVGLQADAQLLHITGNHSRRPSHDEAVKFMKDALRQDTPVAFLNYSSGKVHNLDGWHWVTMTGLEQRGNKVFLTLSDEGRKKEIDYTLWHNTSRMGGSLVALKVI
jgi:hypothetical protein